jgi:hypothetical protein
VLKHPILGVEGRGGCRPNHAEKRKFKKGHLRLPSTFEEQAEK